MPGVGNGHDARRPTQAEQSTGCRPVAQPLVFPGAFLSRDVKADDKTLGSDGKHNVTLGDVAGAAVDNAEFDFGHAQLFQRASDRFDTTLDVRFQDDVQLFNLTGAYLVVNIGEVNRADFLFRFLPVFYHQRLRFAFAGDHL